MVHSLLQLPERWPCHILLVNKMKLLHLRQIWVGLRALALAFGTLQILIQLILTTVIWYIIGGMHILRVSDQCLAMVLQ